MAKNKISEYSSTASNNTDIGGINIAEGCAPSGINNAIRELMAQIKDQQTGSDADNFVVGGAFTCTGAAVFSSTVALGSTATATTQSSGDNSTKVATTAYVANNAIPSGGIIIWSGSAAAIPTGWYLCNGSNSTPDLRNRFVVGAGSTYAVAATGGSADAIVVSHSHSVTDPGHQHNILMSSANNTLNSTPSKLSTTQNQTGNTETATTGISIQSAGASGTNANLPPYYALCYIMKA
jgi:microcystin-dependent protein